MAREIYELMAFGEAWGDPPCLVREAARYWWARMAERQARAVLAHIPEGRRPIRCYRED